MSLFDFTKNNTYPYQAYKFQADNSKLNKSLQEYDLADANIVYSQDCKYTVFHTLTYILLINKRNKWS